MPLRAVLWDLDGVIVSTDKLHYRSWLQITQSEGIPFDWEINKRLLGVSRMSSLEIILERAPRQYTQAEKEALCAWKNEIFLELTKTLTPQDLLPGFKELARELKSLGVFMAVCSGSKNARFLVQHLAIGPWFEAVIDGNQLTLPKPDPQVFLLGAEALSVPPQDCLVFEDAVAGIEAAHGAGMKAVGVGDTLMLKNADLAVTSLTEVRYRDLSDLF